jgi:hypothetical protein
MTLFKRNLVWLSEYYMMRYMESTNNFCVFLVATHIIIIQSTLDPLAAPCCVENTKNL